MGIGSKTFGRAHGWDEEPSYEELHGPLLPDGTYYSQKPQAPRCSETFTTTISELISNWYAKRGA